jgi:ribosomal-protein-alanine N-acetyltransferase
MKSTDVPQVVDIDRASFTPAWSAASYHFEIHQSIISYMVVLAQPSTQKLTGWRYWWQKLRPPRYVHELTDILGFAGMWKIEDEAHISTIASHPDQRGKHYGEVLLAGMIEQAIRLRSAYVALEVRVSNTVAQNLYHKYHFQIEDIKRAYYQHNNEDAYDMRLELTPANIAYLHDLYQAVRHRVSFQDEFTQVPHPRLGR